MLSRRRDLQLPRFHGPWIETLLLAFKSSYHLKLVVISLGIFLVTVPLKMVRIFK